MRGNVCFVGIAVRFAHEEKRTKRAQPCTHRPYSMLARKGCDAGTARLSRRAARLPLTRVRWCACDGGTDGTRLAAALPTLPRPTVPHVDASHHVMTRPDLLLPPVSSRSTSVPASPAL